jgi:hypothetical protein
VAPDELSARERQMEHVLATRARQVAAAERELAVLQDPMWAAKALVDAQVRMSLSPRDGTMWRGYAVKPERILGYLTGGRTDGLLSVGMLVEALDELVERKLVTRGRAGDYWWAADELP